MRPILVYSAAGGVLPGPDDDLIHFARQGHRPAFERLVERTARLVWAHLLPRTRDRALCEDLVQETYLRAWRSIGQLDDPANFRAWLLTIADHAADDNCKRRLAQKRGPRPASLGGSDVAPGSASPNGDIDSPAEQAQRNELRGRALEALAALPALHRQALSLRYLSGADAAEIEQQLGITNGALRGLLHRGLEMLRDALKDE